MALLGDEQRISEQDYMALLDEAHQDYVDMLGDEHRPQHTPRVSLGHGYQQDLPAPKNFLPPPLPLDEMKAKQQAQNLHDLVAQAQKAAASLSRAGGRVASPATSGGRPPLVSPPRVPLSAMAVPQPTSINTPSGKGDIEVASKYGDCLGDGAAEYDDYDPMTCAGGMAEEYYSTGQYSSTCRSSRWRGSNSPSQTSRASSPRPTSPRTRMTDILHGTHSIIRHPELQRRNKNLSRRNTRGFTTPMQSPRNLAGDNYPRRGLGVSNDCVNFLRQCQNHVRVEDLVDEMLSEGQQDPRRRDDYTFARDNIRNASYRDATKCATSMARRTKPSPLWR